jgi:hypothetical protein
MPARLARALQMNALFRSESSARDKGAASLHIRRLCAMCRVHLVNGDLTNGGPASAGAGVGLVAFAFEEAPCHFFNGIN